MFIASETTSAFYMYSVSAHDVFMGLDGTPACVGGASTSFLYYACALDDLICEA